MKNIDENLSKKVRPLKNKQVLLYGDGFQEPAWLLMELKSLSRINTFKASCLILANWTCIFCCTIAAISSENWAIYLLAMPIVASRQHALLVLMHDASHFKLFPNRKVNNFVAEWFLSYPCFITTAGYRSNHLQHHTKLNSHDDPDLKRKLNDPTWKFPVSQLRLLKIALFDLFGGQVIRNLKSVYQLGVKTKSGVSKRRNQLTFYILLFGALSYFQLWFPFVVLWVVPLFTFLGLALRLRGIAEHFGLDWQNDFSASRNVEYSFLEKWFLGPHEVGYHLVHHLYPFIPCYNLNKLHHSLMKITEYESKNSLSKGFFGSDGTSVMSQLSQNPVQAPMEEFKLVS